jgi:hypothetical protein
MLFMIYGFHKNYDREILSFLHLSIHPFVWSFVCSVACHTILPEPLPKPQNAINYFLFQFPYPFISLRPSSSFSHFLPPHLPVTSIIPCIFLSITCLRRQFLRKMWPIHSTFLLFIVCRTFLFSFTLCNTSPFLTRSVQLISILLQHHISKLSRYFWSTFPSVQVLLPYKLHSRCTTSLASSQI